MTTLVERSPEAGPIRRPGQTVLPFVVSGTLLGNSLCLPAADLDEIVAHIDRWTRIDENSTGHWRLHEDYSEPVTMIVRLRDGLGCGSHRISHLVRLRPGQPQGIQLTTGCGEQMTIVEAEVLAMGVGMPCERCLLTMPDTAPDIWWGVD